MRERLLILALLLLGLLISTARVEAKTTVSVEDTTITFDVPIVIWVPVKLEPADPEEKEQLRQDLVEQIGISRDTEPLRVCRRPFGLSYAAMAGSSSMA